MMPMTRYAGRLDSERGWLERADDPVTGISVRFMRYGPRELTPWEQLNRNAFPIDPNAPAKCCDGINGSHTGICPVNYGKTVHCWCCGEDQPAHWAGLWSEKGYRCMGCEGCDYHGDGVGCAKLAAQARALMGCQ